MTSPDQPQSQRLIAFGPLAACLACLRLQHDALHGIAGDMTILQLLWLQAGYLQPLSMLVLAGLMFGVTQKRAIPQWLMLSAIFATCCGAGLGLPLTPAQFGSNFWPATLLRWSIGPAALIWWLSTAPPAPSRRDLAKLAIGPLAYLAYLAYMLIRGMAQGLWPAAELQQITTPQAALLPFGGAMLAYGLLTALTALFWKTPKG